MTRPKHYIWIFWVMSIFAVALSWRLLPTTFSGYVLLVALLVMIGFSLSNINEPMYLGTFAFASLMISYLQVSQDLDPLYISLMTVVLVLLVGLAADHLISREDRHIRLWIYWICLAFMIAQAQTLLSYWPVSMFSRTVLLLVIFYALWQLFRFNSDSNRWTMIAHFAYIGVTAIVIVGTIIWANFPQLLPF